MVYVAARPTDGTGAVVRDTDELAEVRWVSLAEADELMSGQVFEPVRQHLQQALATGDGDQGGLPRAAWSSWTRTHATRCGGKSSRKPASQSSQAS